MLKLVEEEMVFEYFFQIRKWRKYYRRFTDIIVSEGKWFLLALLITVGKRK